jgi:hypothetical protein
MPVASQPIEILVRLQIEAGGAGHSMKGGRVTTHPRSYDFRVRRFAIRGAHWGALLSAGEIFIQRS